MKKKLILCLGVGALTLSVMTGCEPQKLMFEKKEMEFKRAESIIENRLEIENGKDYDVSITVDGD